MELTKLSEFNTVLVENGINNQLTVLSRKGVCMMEKVMVFLKGPDSEDREHFRNRYLQEHTKRVLAETDAVRYHANVVEDAPDILTPELFSIPYPGVDAVDELWFQEEAVLPAVYQDNGLSIVAAYRVDERVMQFCPPHWPLGERSPWFKRINFLRRKEILSRDAFSDHWRNIHGPLALKIHLTVQYIQNLIAESLTDEPAPWDGVVQLDFRSKDDFKNHFFPYPDSKAIMMEDVAKFTADTDKPRYSLILSEYVQR